MDTFYTIDAIAEKKALSLLNKQLEIKFKKKLAILSDAKNYVEQPDTILVTDIEIEVFQKELEQLRKTISSIEEYLKLLNILSSK